VRYTLKCLFKFRAEVSRPPVVPGENEWVTGTLSLSVGTARRAARGGFGETAIPVVTRFWCDKMSKL
jgi:hypothetical protein